MKKVLVLTAMVLLVAVQAMAGVTGSRHDMATWGSAGQGVCSFCHVPHSAQGARLWPQRPNATIASNFGLIGALCASCHTVNTFTVFANVNGTVFNQSAVNHPLSFTGTLPDTDPAGTAWPYTSASPMQCTSCHDVHNQTSSSSTGMIPLQLGQRNFLRAPYYLGTSAAPTGLYCDRCHLRRTATASHNSFSTPAISTHPVGGVVNDGRSGTSATVIMTLTNYAQIIGTEGGHRSSGSLGGVVCVTCHRPHGSGSANLLIRGNTTDGYNTECEDCHGTYPSLSDPNGAPEKNAHPVNAGTGDWAVNRGGATATISMVVYNTALTGAVQGLNREVICLSCHAVHRADAGTLILREEMVSVGDGICNDCHGAVFSGRNSHPVGSVIGSRTNEDGGVWPNKDSLPYVSGATVTYIDCTTCHAAHNGATTTGTRFILKVADNMSEICIGCHTQAQSNAALFPVTSPTVQSGSANPSYYIQEALYAASVPGEVNYSAARGTRLGTHPAYRLVQSPAHTGWQITFAASVLSNYYGTSGTVIICQSCHTPHDADTTGGWHGSAGSRNLLYRANGVAETRTGDNGGYVGPYTPASPPPFVNGEDSICQACHVPGGTHPVQDWTVSKTGVACNETSSYTLATIVSPADYALGAARSMTCESCHAPHAASTSIGSYCLEAGTGTAANGGDRPTVRSRDALCFLCHSY